MRYSTVLAATDFSELGDLALRRAANIALDAKARLHLIHVMPEPPAPSPLFPHYQVVIDKSTQTKAEEGARQALESRIPADLKEQGLTCEHEVRTGDPANEILTSAADIGADLIVVATQGRRGFERFVLGSVAERVQRLATVDVLCVRPTDVKK